MKIWDSFIRVYHWGQVILLGSLWYTAEEGLMEWHFTLAYLLMALLSTRILWGIVGSDTAKFTHFVTSPKKAISYFSAMKSGKVSQAVGHNPAGGYMVLGLFFLLVLQLTTGLFSNDDILSEGPLASLVSYDTSSLLTSIHHQIFNVLLGFIGLHIIAVLFYRVKGVNLITPMLTGIANVVGNSPKMKNVAIAWGIFTIISVLIYFLWANEVISYLF
ncbi:hydrogenase [Aliivibrio finisterrensis]|uniref:cytochrome b/b6 domain-containing protein n=1 Tax=Aliivibrio finisterrensis TaxID=511998 RepID=UPI001022816C|nr:cytochrome b/b6 domain-containing protein [Aliivibrio finisterrensis]RYU64545.1 hydrogenase [Aliivibrio finisterrensis]RYU67950.1 hydrogenase [Aliivibrio finisterrensis]RYU70960.1 hydrogenase [Aliivibrio finisterrensis]